MDIEGEFVDVSVEVSVFSVRLTVYLLRHGEGGRRRRIYRRVWCLLLLPPTPPLVLVLMLQPPLPLPVLTFILVPLLLFLESQDGWDDDPWTVDDWMAAGSGVFSG